MRAWRMGFGEFAIFWESRIALTLWALFVLTFAGGPFVRLIRRMRAR